MPIDTKAVEIYMTELAEAAGIAPEQRAAFLSNEKVVSLARRRFEDVEAERGRTAAEARARKEEFDKNMTIYQQNLKAVTDADAKVKAYEEKYGALDPATRAAAVSRETQDIIDKKTFDEALSKRDGDVVALSKAVMKITARHIRDFPAVDLDPDAITDIALKQGLSAEKAYEAWIEPKVKEKQKLDYDAALKAAREEGFRDGASKRAAGQIESSERPSGFYENMIKGKVAGEAQANPSEAFREAYTNYKPPVRSA